MESMETHLRHRRSRAKEVAIPPTVLANLAEVLKRDPRARSIKLSRGFVAIVDDEVYSELSKFTWHADVRRSSIVYAVRNRHLSEGGPGPEYMHRRIMGSPRIEVDHHVHLHHLGIVDNRRVNLRLAGTSNNQANRRKLTTTSSIFKGVTYSKKSRRWQSQVGGGRKSFLGLFEVESYAAYAYDLAALERFGEYARTNFIGPNAMFGESPEA